MEVEVQDALESIATNQRERAGTLEVQRNLREWLPWWRQLERIHKDDTSSDVDKFHYLHQAVTKGSRAQTFLEG
ncbi:hypothetical protein LAZ67_18001846 [Cordylochernes scorpioides]|uniref:Uncharacterized protein n=1 Tax=Cordylochernes scorpioides TaxID=51811 RepID=A0ABY6LJW7_9ARAC|nr:hypothetical protein LAZ67_18001846 [Cordylochernes scorpioides]